MNSPEAHTRLEQLEASVAHLERLTDQLNEALVDQSRQIARLQKRLELLGQSIETRDASQPTPPIERPPHYGR